MRMIALTLEDIRFERKVYDLDLKESIARRGLAFPLKVAIEKDGYICVDGHKRLSVLDDLKEDSRYERFITKIPVIVINSDHNRSNDCWRARNTH